ncbi:uL30 family ribosomal protein [Candidatus Woesearchaeota archaeon]|nr:uL30 family ribosomal protein [Candidatus Woesearchaeota archaeon]
MKEEGKEEKPVKKIAVIRIRGLVGIKKGTADTLNMLRLYRKNYCIVLSGTPSILGMLNKVKDYITWGEINDETLKMLREKRLEKTKNKEGKVVEKKFFRLHPPRKGFARKGIKIPFKVGGALGNRKDKINDLIKRMI